MAAGLSQAFSNIPANVGRVVENGRKRFLLSAGRVK
jgi:hypothetical protein